MRGGENSNAHTTHFFEKEYKGSSKCRTLKVKPKPKPKLKDQSRSRPRRKRFGTRLRGMRCNGTQIQGTL